jgi:hypothetical protein
MSVHTHGGTLFTESTEGRSFRKSRQVRPSVSSIFMNEVVGPFTPMAAPYSLSTEGAFCRTSRKVHLSVSPMSVNEFVCVKLPERSIQIFQF